MESKQLIPSLSGKNEDSVSAAVVLTPSINHQEKGDQAGLHGLQDAHFGWVRGDKNPSTEEGERANRCRDSQQPKRRK